MGHRPTSKRFSIDSVDICRFKDGKIVEHWGVADTFSLMSQLGLTQGS